MLKLIYRATWHLGALLLKCVVYLLTDLCFLISMPGWFVRNTSSPLLAFGSLLLLAVMIALSFGETHINRANVMGRLHPFTYGLTQVPAVLSVITLFASALLLRFEPFRQPVVLDGLFSAVFVLLVAVRLFQTSRQAEAARIGRLTRKSEERLAKGILDSIKSSTNFKA